MAELDRTALAGALRREGQQRDLRVDAEELCRAGGLDCDLSQLLCGREGHFAGCLVNGILIVDVDGAVAHAVLFVVAVLVLAEEDEGRGHQMRAFLRLDQLQRRTDGIGGGIGRAAEQCVGLAHLDKHGAEIIALGECLAAVFLRHLALAQFDHLLNHFVHAGIGCRVDDLGLCNVEAALFCCGLNLVNIADENDVHQIVLDEAVCRFENTGVRAFGKDDGAAGCLQCVDQLCKHGILPPLCGFPLLSSLQYTTKSSIKQHLRQKNSGYLELCTGMVISVTNFSGSLVRP